MLVTVSVTAANFWVASLYDFPFYCSFPKDILSVNELLLQLIANLHTCAIEEVEFLILLINEDYFSE